MFTGSIEGVGTVEIKRLHLADVTLPQGTPLAGQICPVYGFLVLHPQGPVLFDTGLGDHPLIDQLYHPVRWPLADALAAVNLRPTDMAAIVNSHLHADHCGGNALFPGTPIMAQAPEYEAAHDPLYTIPDWVDFPGANFRLLAGEAEILPGLTLLPTPGHTPGHQSLLIRAREGTIIIAGQAAYTAAEYDRPELGHVWGLEAAWDREKYLESLRRLQALGPRQVYLSHDEAVWQPGIQTDAAS